MSYLSPDPDQYLYRFRSFDWNRPRDIENAEKLFIDRQAFFVSPAFMNDPFDCKIPPTFTDGTHDEYRAFLHRALPQRFPSESQEQVGVRVEQIMNGFPLRTDRDRDEFIQHLQTIIDGVGILSFSEDPTHSLMWSHYANSHQGYCLQFAHGADSFLGRAQKVEYSENMPLIRYITAPAVEAMKGVLLTKAADWSYEREWRVIEHIKGHGYHPFPIESLTGVIFGLCMVRPKQRRIAELALKCNPNIKFYGAVRKDKQYGVKIEKVELSGLVGSNN